MFILLVTVVLNFYLLIIVPKGFFPEADDGRIFGGIRGDQSISFQSMQKKFAQFVQHHPRGSGGGELAGSIGGGGGGRRRRHQHRQRLHHAEAAGASAAMSAPTR